jgi:hypothetical protein
MHLRAAPSLSQTLPRGALSKRHASAANRDGAAKTYEAVGAHPNKLDNAVNRDGISPTGATAGADDAASAAAAAQPKPRSSRRKTYPPRVAKPPSMSQTAKAKNKSSYEARLKAKAATSDNPAERAAAMAQRARNAVRGNALKHSVDAYRSVAAAAEWLDAGTELPVFRALRACASDYNRAQRLVSAAMDAARAEMGGIRGGGDAAETTAAVAAAAEAAVGKAQWAEWQVHLLRGRRCYRWLYDTGLENMRRAGVRGDRDGPPTEAWAWLMSNWPRIQEKWDALGESDASDEEVLASRAVSSGDGGGWTLGYRTGSGEAKEASPRRRPIPRLLSLDGFAWQSERSVQDWQRAISRAADAYVRRAGNAWWRATGDSSRGAGAIQSYVPSPEDVASALRQGIVAHAMRSPRPFQSPVGLGRP